MNFIHIFQDFFNIKGKLPKIQHNLLDALKITINALERNIFKYDWYDPHCCNCGVVVSAMLGKEEGTSEYFRNATIDSGLGLNSLLTWKDVCQVSCTITGKPMTEVFEKLFEFGLQPKDIVHLEYMDNAAILKESDIDMSEFYYATKKENLILYLKAWVRILNKTAERIAYTKRQNLEADLLIATAFEKFEEARNIQLDLAIL